VPGLALLTAALVVGLAYLLGSFPTGYLAGRLLKGVDIRQVGDRYMGTKNVFFQVGPGAAIVVCLVDVAKGMLAVLLAREATEARSVILGASLAVVAGHIWPVYLGFRNGAGAATALGTMLALGPKEVLGVSVLSVIPLAVTRRTDVTCGFIFALLPLAHWWQGHEVFMMFANLPVAVLVGLRVYRRELRATLTKLWSGLRRPEVE